MLQPNTLLQNRYRVVSHVGAGGMGAVYVATDERFGSTIALKETFFREAVMLRAFEREAKLLNRLRHPALPRVSDHFTEGDGQFLVMEFIAGEDLSAMLERDGAFPASDVLRWADELLDALDYLHTQEPSIIHRDIKPQNLKLTPRGQIILLDFGLAKGTPWQASHATASVFGYSRNYAPIEQIRGTGTDTRSDIYSLGATLYHLLTAQPPPDALTRAMAVLNNQADPLRPASEVHPQVSTQLAAVISRAMAQTAAGRPDSAAAMREELRRASRESGASDARAIIAPLATTVATAPAHGATTPAQTSSEQETQILDARAAQPTVRDVAAQPTERIAHAASSQSARDETAMADETRDVDEATRIARAPVVARATRRQSLLRSFAVAGLVAALCAVVAAFIYNFAKKTLAPDETNAPQVAQPAPPTGTQQQTDSAATPLTNETTTNSQKANEPAVPQATQQVAPLASRHGGGTSGTRATAPAPVDNQQPASGGARAGQTSESRAATKPADASPATSAPDEESFTPNAPPPRGVVIPPNIDWAHMTPAERKKFVRYVRRQVVNQQQRDNDPQPPQPLRRRRRPPP
jgi:hypothetical protein